MAPSTVSRTFTRPGRISLTTVGRVREVAERLGYQPNLTARGLSTGRTGNLAMVIPNIANPFFTDLMQAFHAAANAHGYSVFLIDIGESREMEAERLAEMTTQTDGVLLVSPRMVSSKLTSLVTTSKFVLVNRIVPGVPSIDIDSSKAIHVLLRDLQDAGHKKIVYVRGPALGYSDQRRRRLIRQICLERGLQLWTTPFSKNKGFDASATLELVLTVGATALLAHSDVVAIEVLSQCRRMGISVPEDLSIIGHDNIRMAEAVYPRLSTIDAKTHLAGKSSAELLVDFVEGRLSPPYRTLKLSAEYVQRDSSGAAAR